MHRSSETIAALAAALAKAQSEITNPEKSLVAKIGADRPGEGARTFRYAPLASGLEIVRKALGQQQIATVQTTAIDVATGTVNLTTVLAHASGEWIASDWPVCRIADTAAPHRMGAALTYARRYALFTLVGIAGEDDLDAPDLNCRQESADTTAVGIIVTGVDNTSRRSVRGRKDSQRAMLDPDASAALRERLIHEVASLNSAAEAAQWARTVLPTKSTLTASDARFLEVAFELRLSAFLTEASPSSGPLGPEASATRLPSSGGAVSTSHGAKPSGIDKSALPIGEARRYRDKEHLKFVASLPCLLCGRKPCDPHHLRFAQVRALGRKVSDEFTVPLCRLHHRELHRARDEAGWWAKLGIDAVSVARKLWLKTRSPVPAADSIATQPIASAPTVAPAPAKPRHGWRVRKGAGAGPIPPASNRA
jgi:hypothetical protein